MTIVVGNEYEFYCELQQETEPPEKRLRRFTGQRVTVIRGPLGPRHNDPENSPLFEVRAADGTKFHAWEEELSGWDYDRDQFFWADGTHGKSHDRAFLVNEAENQEADDGTH